MSATLSSPWMSRRRRVGLSALFLVYLVYVGLAIADHHASPAGQIVGYAVLGGFAVTYLVLVDRAPDLRPARFLAGVALLCALMVAELPATHAIGFTLSLYITTIAVSRFGKRALPAVPVLALVTLFVPVAVDAWHTSLAGSLGYVTPIAVPVAAGASMTIRRIIASNHELAVARAEVAQLSAEAERTRIARDLHDLLGHSLTTITVKAGLAHRLGESGEPARAVAEIAEVESLARRTLQDVRTAVAGYREVTLAGELAAGRELLRAAGVDADLPHAVDAVGDAHQELFGWAVREGLTNVVRHAEGAGSCVVRVSATAVEILDDGHGATAGDRRSGGSSAGGGSGLAGLRERAAAAGAIVESGPRPGVGWRLRVGVPEAMR